MGTCCSDEAPAPPPVPLESVRQRRIRRWKDALYYYDATADKSASELVAVLLLEANVHELSRLYASETHLESFLVGNDADPRLARIVGKWQRVQRQTRGLSELATGATAEGIQPADLRVARV
jgi:hypothetical protein